MPVHYCIQHCYENFSVLSYTHLILCTQNNDFILNPLLECVLTVTQYVQINIIQQFDPFIAIVHW